MTSPALIGVIELLPCVCFIAALLLPLLWALAMYNALVRARQHVKEAWAQIDTELRRRYDLIPNLVETVKAYAKHERQTLEQTIEARNRAHANEAGSPADQARDENQMVGALGRLLAVAEAYPDLKADRNFLQLQHELANTEDRIQRVRRFYNGNVRDLNTKVQVFPTSVLAGMFGFVQAEYFEVDPAVRGPVQVDLEPGEGA